MGHTLRLIAGAALLLLLAACHAPSDGATSASPAPMELKIYAVPAGQAARLSEALNKAFGKNASVTTPSPDQLLIYAPKAAQASIGAAITELGKPAAATTPAQVNLRFWVVDADTGAGTDDPALKPLSAALDGVRQNMGPLHFRLDQAVAAVGSSGHDGSIVTATDDGYPRNFDFHINGVTGNSLNLWLGYEDHGNAGLAMIKTQLDIDAGHYTVLAQAPGACPPALLGKTASPCPQKPALRLLIVRADPLPPNT